ncbi:MAG: aKG-HExxH-type peptide beta-hydroxylase, partial [Bdellovibrionota bacterium]
ISEYSELRLSKLKRADRFTAICFDKSGDLAQQAVRALSVLSTLWPEMANVVKTFVSHVLWVESEGYWSGSYAEAHGLVFISPKRDWTLAHYIESLVHEASHLELMVQQALDPLLINKDQLDVSPLREEPRPLDGILHASFVTRRTTHALSLFAEASDLGSEAERESARSLLNKFTQDFESTLVCLRRAAKFTPIGASLFHDLQH